MGKLEMGLWAADFIITGIGWALGGGIAAMFCFVVGGILVFLVVAREDKNPQHPPQLKKWHRYGFAAFSTLAIILLGYTFVFRFKKGAQAAPAMSQTSQSKSQAAGDNQAAKPTQPTPTIIPKKPKSQSVQVEGDNNTSGNIGDQSGSNNNAVIGNGNNVGNTYYGSGDSGWLVPAHDPTPANRCAQDVIDQGGFIVFLGSMAAGASHMPNVVMTAGGKPRITLDTNERGELAVTTDIFDSKDDIVVELNKNKYTVSNDAFRVEKPDPSTLTVTVKHQKEKVLDVRFMNKHAIRVLGHFRYPGSPDLVADESGINVGGIRMGGAGCMVNSGQGLPDFEF